MGSRFIGLDLPASDGPLCLAQALELVRIQTLISKLRVETLEAEAISGCSLS